MHQRVESITQQEIKRFQRKIWAFYGVNARTLPFRHFENPYRVTVSEVMLQQTQVERVIPKYREWIRRWPSWRSLSRASRRDVLSAWSGLGYNRRAIHLQESAQIITEQYRGRLPRSVSEVRALPGIGEYTASAILIFSYNSPLVAIDTNIRQVFIHEFDLAPETSSQALVPLAERALPREKARDWHYALMDYARLALKPELKRLIIKPRQSKFEGSNRQIRGEILRQLTQKPSVTLRAVASRLDRSIVDTRIAAQQLQNERIIEIRGSTLSLVE